MPQMRKYIVKAGSMTLFVMLPAFAIIEKLNHTTHPDIEDATSIHVASMRSSTMIENNQWLLLRCGNVATKKYKN